MEKSSVVMGDGASLKRCGADLDLDAVIEGLKGVVCILFSLSVSGDVGRHKYAGSEMLLISKVLNNLIYDLEPIANHHDDTNGE